MNFKLEFCIQDDLLKDKDDEVKQTIQKTVDLIRSLPCSYFKIEEYDSAYGRDDDNF